MKIKQYLSFLILPLIQQNMILYCLTMGEPKADKDTAEDKEFVRPFNDHMINDL